LRAAEAGRLGVGMLRIDTVTCAIALGLGRAGLLFRVLAGSIAGVARVATRRIDVSLR
jgi:hypothetical protein